MKVRPLGDRVLLKRMENVTKTKSGLFLPGEAQHKSTQAVVAALGTGRMLDNGSEVPLRVKIGDHVVCAKHAGENISVEGEEFWLVREHDIQYVVEHEEDEK